VNIPLFAILRREVVLLSKIEKRKKSCGLQRNTHEDRYLDCGRQAHFAPNRNTPKPRPLRGDPAASGIHGS